MNIKDGMHKTK